MYLSQADDKNSLLARRITDPKARRLVEDQGRALILLEKLVLPYGQEAYEEDEMTHLLKKKLVKKGHRIQGDTEEDDEKYASEKKKATEARRTKVPSLFGMVLEDAEQPSEAPVEDPKILVPPPPPRLGKPSYTEVKKSLDKVCLCDSILVSGLALLIKFANRFAA